MEVILIIGGIYIACFFFEKTEKQVMKEADNLPPFTKIEAENYYFTELQSKHRSYYCQSEIEGNIKCIHQCGHCKEYYKQLEQ